MKERKRCSMDSNAKKRCCKLLWFVWVMSKVHREERIPDYAVIWPRWGSFVPGSWQTLLLHCLNWGDDKIKPDRWKLQEVMSPAISNSRGVIRRRATSFAPPSLQMASLFLSMLSCHTICYLSAIIKPHEGVLYDRHINLFKAELKMLSCRLK